MIIKTLNRGQSQEAMNEWIEKYPNLPVIDDEMMQLRRDMQAINKKIREEINADDSIKREDYYLDYNFGLFIYEYFNNQPGFSMRVAANDGFWRYLSLKVIPDVVTQRWGKDNESHFWSHPTRIWLRSVWWYVHMAWQGNYESTKKVLSCNHFTTDTILNFEERTGRNGTYMEVYREIIKLYSELPLKEVKKNKNSDDIFRVVMKLNTAKMLVMDPALYLGGVEAYVKSLFIDSGVNINAT